MGLGILYKGGGFRAGGGGGGVWTLDEIFEYRFPISIHLHRSVSNTCRRHVSISARQCFSVIYMSSKLYNGRWLCGPEKWKDSCNRAQCCSVFETRLQMISHRSWPPSFGKGRLSTPLHLSNLQATQNCRIVIRICSNTQQWLAVPTVSVEVFVQLDVFLPCGNTHVSVFCFVLGGPGANSFANTHASGTVTEICLERLFALIN